MTLPADVGSPLGGASVWSDWAPGRPGPFANGPDLYALTVDRGANRVRAYRSQDGGHTWAEQDDANAPATATAAGLRVVDALAWGTDLYAANCLSTSSMNVLRFSMSSNAWQTAIAGPAITLTALTTKRLCLARVTNTTDFLALFYNGATETIMSTVYNRVKVHQYNATTSTWSGPYDAQGSADSPAANTLPGTQTHYYAQTTVVGAGARVHLFWVTGTTGGLRHRILTPGTTPAFGGASTAVGADAPTDFGVGTAAAYANGSATGIAVPYGLSTGYTVARCGDSTTAATAGNWTTAAVSAQPPERTAGVGIGAVAAAGARLYAFEVTDAGRELHWADDGGSGAWPGDVAPWKRGADVLCRGVAAAAAGGEALGVLYGDALGDPDLAQTAYDTEYPVGATSGSGNRRAQSFRLAAGRTVKSVRLLVTKTGAPASGLQCDIETDAAGAPSGTPVGGAMFVLGPAAAEVLATPVWQTWIINTPVALASATDYWLVVTSIDAVSATDHYSVWGAAADVYAAGARADGTGVPAWTPDGAGGDLAFSLYATEGGLERVRYDRLVTLRTTAAQAAGTTTGAAVDLGEAGPNDATVLLSVGDAGDPAGTVEVVVEHSDDGAAWAEATRGLSEGASLRDVVALTGVGRYLRLVSTVTGADTPDVGTVAV